MIQNGLFRVLGPVKFIEQFNLVVQMGRALCFCKEVVTSDSLRDCLQKNSCFCQVTIKHLSAYQKAYFRGIMFEIYTMFIVCYIVPVAYYMLHCLSVGLHYGLT